MKKIFLILGLFLLVAAGVGFYLYNKPHDDIESANTDYQMAADELFAAFETNEADANEKYLDKIIEISGQVREVSADEDGNLSITLDSGSEMFGVICQMDTFSGGQRKSFEMGEHVTLKGICTGMLMDVVLVRCVEV